jgi:Uma2 family endonuclease
MSEHPAQPHFGRQLTFEEWAAMDEDEPGELVDGYLEEEELPNVIHEVVLTWFAMVFRTWLGRRGWVIGSGAKFAVRPNRGRKPDLTVYLGGERKPPANGIVRVPPDIAVEVVSPSARDGRRDRIEKMAEYAAFGIRYYWLIDPAFRSLEIFELMNGHYARTAYATEGTMTSVPGCEGLTIDLDALWQEIAELERN